MKETHSYNLKSIEEKGNRLLQSRESDFEMQRDRLMDKLKEKERDLAKLQARENSNNDKIYVSYFQ
jgi:hypothetical protein